MSTETERVANCRSCNAEVVFRLNPKTGKAPPYDYPPETCIGCNGSGITRTEAVVQGAVMAGFIEDACKRCRGEGKIWISHFATCDHAAKWKGKARGR